MTEVISGFPCIGKTTLGNSNKFKYMDLEFRETASARGMTKEDADKLYENYIDIVKNIYQTGYYDYLMVTDNKFMLDRLIREKIPFTYIVPNYLDKEYLDIHKERVLNRNDEDWYQAIIVPRLITLEETINKLINEPTVKIKNVTLENPFVKDVLRING